MKQSWTSGLNKELANDVRTNFREALVTRRRLVKMLNDKIESSAKEGRSKLLYDNPNWALLQADQRGYERAFAEIIALIDDGVSPNA